MAQPIIAGIIQSVSTSPLNDQEPGFTFLRWPVADLTDYFNQALIEICNYRPDAFIVTQDIPVLGAGVGGGFDGSRQALPAGFRLLKSIDANGLMLSNCPGAPVVECDLNLMRTFYKAPCLPTGGATEYRVLDYAYDAKNPNTFYVSPPVPTGNTFNVTASLVKDPDQFVQIGGGNSLTWTPVNDLTIDQAYYTAIRFFMAAKAFEVDTESSTSQAESEKLYKKFYNLLGVQYKQASDYNGGKYLGQGTDHNMTKERVA